MKNKYILIIAFFALISVSFSCGSSRRTVAVEEGWEILGELTVNFARDRDILQVSSSSKYSALRFKIEERAVKIQELKVVFANLDKLEPAIDEEVQPDQYSKIIELGPEGKEVRSVEFNYRTTGNVLKGRAKVIVFGKRFVPLY